MSVPVARMVLRSGGFKEPGSLLQQMLWHLRKHIRAYLTGPQVSSTATKCSMKSLSSLLYATPPPIRIARPVRMAAGAAYAASFPPSSESSLLSAACFPDARFPLPLLDAPA